MAGSLGCYLLYVVPNLGSFAVAVALRTTLLLPLDDLLSVLLNKGIVLVTDLPKEAQRKLMQRRHLRRTAGDLGGLVDLLDLVDSESLVDLEGIGDFAGFIVRDAGLKALLYDDANRATVHRLRTTADIDHWIAFAERFAVSHARRALEREMLQLTAAHGLDDDGTAEAAEIVHVSLAAQGG